MIGFNLSSQHQQTEADKAWSSLQRHSTVSPPPLFFKINATWQMLSFIKHTKQQQNKADMAS